MIQRLGSMRQTREGARPSKPAEGAPCNGCGVCCLMEVCSLPEAFGMPIQKWSPGPCPILEYAENRYWCGFVRSPEKHLKLKCPPDEFSAEVKDFLGDGLCDTDAPAGHLDGVV